MGGYHGNDGWMSVSSPNGLADVHWLHVASHNGTPRIDKDKRDVFVKGRIQDIRRQFQVKLKLKKNTKTKSCLFLCLFVVKLTSKQFLYTNKICLFFLCFVVRSNRN